LSQSAHFTSVGYNGQLIGGNPVEVKSSQVTGPLWINHSLSCSDIAAASLDHTEYEYYVIIHSQCPGVGR